MKAMLVLRYMKHCFVLACLVVVVLVAAVPLQAASATYFGVTFPQGDLAFADRVVDYVAASCVRDAYDDPEEALGPPDAICDGCEGCDGCDTNAVSLGFRLSVLDNRGYLILQFVDNALTDVAGDDLFVYNTNHHRARVEISEDGYSFIDVGETVGYPGAIDIGPYVNDGDMFYYVRLSDVPADEDHSSCPGPSIDAVGAMGPAQAVATGEAFGSLELQPVGDLALSLQNQNAANKIYILLDTSSSMGDPIDGGVKIDVAKDVLLDLLSNLPEDTRVAIRTFGFGCGTDLLAPMGVANSQQLRQQILGIEPRGSTPIAEALRATEDDLQSTPDPQLILLISDGIETCGGNPVQAAKDLIGMGYNLKFHIVGFDIDSDVRAQAQLIEIAQSTGGMYVDANSSQELRQALSLVAPFSYTVYDQDGNEVAAGRLGEAGPQLPVGTYRIVIDTTPPITVNADVKEQQTTKITVQQSNGGFQAEVGN
jgi:Mg-chelatase subunit ChlD